MLGAAFPIIPTFGGAGGVIVGPRLAWANGYRYRIRNAITKEIHQQPDGAQGWVKYWITDPVLRSIANGGNVANDAAWPDIRFEMGSGALLKYELESWDAASGALVTYVLLTNFSSSGDYIMLLYYGKAGITANESDPISCWSGFAQSVKMSTGADMSGNGRHFTLTNVAPAMIFNGAAGVFSGTEVQLVAPSNTGVPVVSPTTSIVVSAVLSTTNGTWSNSPTSYAYQWRANSVNISGATAATFTVTAAQVGATITCGVTASNAAGSATAESAAVGPVAGAVSSGDDTLPMGGAFYGVDRPADGSGNRIYRYRQPTGVRFVAEITGNIVGVSWNNRFNSGSQSGYSAGNGGTIRLEIRPDTGLKHPPFAPGTGSAQFAPLASDDPNLLGRTADYANAASNAALTAWPRINFQSPVPVVKGTRYWCVYNQLDSSGNNWLSTNSDDLKGFVDGREEVDGGPYWGFSWRVARSNGTTWTPAPSSASDQGNQMMRLQFRYRLADNSEIWSGSCFVYAVGAAFGAPDGDGTKHKFNDSNPIRMQFTPSQPTFSTNKLWWRAYRDSGDSAAGNMTIKLLRGSTTLGTWTSPNSAWVITKINNSDPPPVPYVPIDLGSAVTIQSGQQHYLQFGAASGGYYTHAQQIDTDVFDCRNVFHDGWGQFSTNSGSSWSTGWHIGSNANSRTDLVLPFLFEIL